MAQTIFSGKERIGRITLERDKDSLRLRWTLKGKTPQKNKNQLKKATSIAAYRLQFLCIISHKTFLLEYSALYKISEVAKMPTPGTN